MGRSKDASYLYDDYLKNENRKINITRTFYEPTEYLPKSNLA